MRTPAARATYVSRRIPMRRKIMTACCALVICASAANAQTTKVDLRNSQPVTTGDYAAFLLSEAFRLHAQTQGLQRTTSIMFNPENMNVIDFQVVSSEV